MSCGRETGDKEDVRCGEKGGGGAGRRRKQDEGGLGG